MRIAKPPIVQALFMKMMTGGQLDIASIAANALRMNIESVRNGCVITRVLNYDLHRNMH